MSNEKRCTTQGGKPMKITFETSGDFENTTNWLKKSLSKSPSSVIQFIGDEGVRALKSNTPQVTGETANGWEYTIAKHGDITELSFVNNAHPELEVNLAKLIDSGHGTGTGGYVPPRPYIERSIKPVFDAAGDKIVKELIE